MHVRPRMRSEDLHSRSRNDDNNSISMLTRVNLLAIETIVVRVITAIAVILVRIVIIVISNVITLVIGVMTVMIVII